MNSLKRFILTYFKLPLILVFRTYWFIFRPKTFGAKVVLINNNEILFVKHTYGYKLSLPGGGLKKDESPEVGGKREISEELGLNVDNLISLGTIVSRAEFKKDTISAFYAELKDRNIKIDNVEIEYVEWISIDKTDSPKIGSVTKKIIDLYKTNNL